MDTPHISEASKPPVLQWPFFHRWISLILKGILVLGVFGSIWERQWATAVFTCIIIAITLAPLLVRKRTGVFIPPEFELLAIGFIFAALFLGEVRGYYVRYWWWDMALHTSSGFLLGIIGFLLVYIMNEKEDIELSMKPGFVALFAFLFALGMGALWEVFEFAADSLFGLNMQKEMLGDPSGLTDTMWDLILDAAGSLVIAILGYGYLTTAGSESFLERWIAKFIDANPQLFERGRFVK